MFRIGIDIGGTFTDFAVWEGSDEGYTAIRSFKVPSSPPRFAEAVMEGLGRLLDEGALTPATEVLIVHGTTVSTNAVIERTGPTLALLTTAGFRDLLQLQRLRLDNPLDYFAERPASLIPRELVFPISARLGPDAAELRPLDPEEVVAAARQAEAAGAVALVVCFLHAYQDGRHEQAAREAIRAAGLTIDVVLSSEVFPQQGEYERAVAAVLNAFVKERMSSYIGELEGFLAERLPRARLLIMRSNGGVMAAAEARAFPVHTLLSGPSAGVTAAQFLGDLTGIDKILTMDMGGTSTDLSLIWRGRASVTTQALVGDFPLMMPVTGIEAIGAGGGSIAALDGGVLTVGPRSAGSRPGPACYGHGGTKPTLSDAYLLCGLLDPEAFLGGAMPLDRSLAAAAMQPIAERLGCDIETAAEACIAVGTSNMVASVLPYLARVGVDPQDLTLLLYGGAGAVHGPLLAEEIGIRRLVVPRTPSVFCALGGVVSDLKHDVVRSVRGKVMTTALLQELFAQQAAEAQAWLAQQLEAALLAGVEVEHYADMRYRGQFFTVDVALPSLDLAAAEAAFHAEHRRIYGHESEAAVEFIGLRARIVGRLTAPAARPLAEGQGGAPRPGGTRRLRLQGRTYPEAPVFHRHALAPGQRFAGPAIVEQADATILVPPGYAAEVGSYGDLVMTKGS